MKKMMVLCFLLLFALTGTAQKSRTIFLEIRGTVDALGTISLDRIETTKKSKAVLDSLINTKELQKEIIRLKEPTSVMLAMAERGWKFCSSMQVVKDESGRPNAPFVAFYFSKAFITEQHENFYTLIPLIHQ